MLVPMASSFLEQIRESLDSGDPLIRSWFLVSEWYAPFALCGCYVLLVTRILPGLMRNRKPLPLQTVMVVYNGYVVLAYLALLLSLLQAFMMTDCRSLLCKEIRVRKAHYTYRITSACWFLYVLKYIEFADSVFYVLRKKEHMLTRLHLVHHTVLPIVAWVLLRSERTGFQLIPAVLNASVHILMYTYYGLAALGPHAQKYLWWKRYLTLVQIMQFVIMFVYLLVVGPMIGCRTSKHGLTMMVGFVALLFWLFYNFYNNTYKAEVKAQNMSRGRSGLCGRKKQS